MPETTIPTDVAVAPEVEAPVTPVDANIAGAEPVVPDAEEVVTEPVLTDREILMKDLGNRRKQSREQDNAEDSDVDDLDAVVNPDAEDSDVDDPMVPLKVNGKEVLKPQSEVDAAGGIAAIQKSLSGDEKLALAAEKEKELDKRQLELEKANETLRTDFNELRSLVSVQKTQGTAQTPEALKARRDKARTIAKQIFNGDADELENAVDELLASATQPGGQPAPQIDLDVVAKKVEKNLTFETDRKKAVNDFAKNHADLHSVPGRKNYVDKLTLVVMSEHPDWLPSQIIEEAVTRTRDELGIPRPAPTPAVDPAPDVLAQRRATKRASTDVIPQASQRGTQPQTKSEHKKSPDEIFAQMQAGRSHR